MAITVKKGFQIDWKVYNSYVKEYEETLIETHEAINKIYQEVQKINTAAVWQDDNSSDFMTWFVKNNKAENSFYKSYKNMASAFGITGRQICTELKKAEPKTYAEYPYVKKYAGLSSIWDASGMAKYKEPMDVSKFDTKRLKDGSKLDLNKLKSAYDNITAGISHLEFVEQKLNTRLLLPMSVKKKGIIVDGVEPQLCNNITAPTDVFKKEFMKQLDNALTKSGIIGNIKMSNK